jgi:probable addiction module antidote protein
MAVNQEAYEKHGFTPFDITEYLGNAEVIAAYLSDVIEDGDNDELLRALGHVARARGMTEIAGATGLSRESLYKALKPGAHPRFDTINRVLHALGVQLQAVPAVVGKSLEHA